MKAHSIVWFHRHLSHRNGLNDLLEKIIPDKKLSGPAVNFATGDFLGDAVGLPPGQFAPVRTVV